MHSPVLIKPNTTDLNVITIDKFLPLLVQQASSTSHIGIDLRELRYIDLFSAIGILLTCDNLIDTYGCRIHLELSEDGACNFLPHMGFLAALPAGVDTSDTFSPARLQWEEALRGDDAKFLELTALTSQDVVKLEIKWH